MKTIGVVNTMNTSDTIEIPSVSPEFKSEIEERATKFGFSTVQDYLIHLILVDKKLDAGMGKSKPRKVRASNPKKPQKSERYNPNKIETLAWYQLIKYLLGNHKDFTKVTFLAPDILATLDSKVNTGGEWGKGVSVNDIDKYLKTIAPSIEGNHISITVCHNGQNIGFVKGKNDLVFGVGCSSQEGRDLLRDWFEEAIEG